MKYTDTVNTKCEIEAVFAIDVLDRKRMLLVEHISTSEPLQNGGLGPQKCGILLVWVNQKRSQLGRPVVTKDAVNPESTIQEIIDHVC